MRSGRKDVVQKNAYKRQPTRENPPEDSHERFGMLLNEQRDDACAFVAEDPLRIETMCTVLTWFTCVGPSLTDQTRDRAERTRANEGSEEAEARKTAAAAADAESRSGESTGTNGAWNVLLNMFVHA